MNPVFRLGSVLRARKAQEDAAKGAVLQSRAEIRNAEALVKRRQFDLAGADAPTEGTARAMVAAMVARQSLAATLTGAHRLVAEAQDKTQEKIAELGDAAKRHRAVEMMSERHTETVRVHDLATDQANLDELAISAKSRNAARGVDGLNEQRGDLLRTGTGNAADREATRRRIADEVAATRAVVHHDDDPYQVITARRADARTTGRPADSDEA
jgi:flagellar export protein FliJ